MHEDGAIQSWRRGAADPVIIAELEAIYAEVASEIAARGPACWASGRCCNFAKTGHLLYVTGLEAMYTLSHAARASQASLPLRTLSLPQVDAARSRGDCPFLMDNACGVHAIKPLGCRVYFCDRSAQAWQQELSERGLERIKRLHDAHAIAYRYGEWRAMLAMCV